MTDELKPVRCGCGGEVVYGKWVRKVGVIAHAVGCKNCGIQTKPYTTEAEAIEAWNRAMGGVVVAKNATTERSMQECAENARCTERKKGMIDLSFGGNVLYAVMLFFPKRNVTEESFMRSAVDAVRR